MAHWVGATIAIRDKRATYTSPRRVPQFSSRLLRGKLVMISWSGRAVLLAKKTGEKEHGQVVIVVLVLTLRDLHQWFQGRGTYLDSLRP